MNKRKALYPIHQMFIDRWSPRAMSGEPITHDQLMTLLEAAHWAPSSFNNQPWRFVHVMRETPHWNSVFDLLVPFNQEWTKNAAVLIVFLSHKTFEYNSKPSRTHTFDTGASWMCLALQGHLMGLVVHGMEGLDYSKAKITLKVPDDYAVEAMCAVGKPGDVHLLSKELQVREEPSLRKPLSEVAFEGWFGNK
jgi:nitroreductase